MYETLIDAGTLARHVGDPDWVIVDCRFDLADTSAGLRAYRKGHIPGAVYAHLDDDLCRPIDDSSGRHPLPAATALVALFGRLGIGHDTQVVAYDDKNGMIASRLWWMLRFMEHEAAAVLNGGWQAWLEAGNGVRDGEEKNPLARFAGSPRLEWLVKAQEVLHSPLLVDSREPERYRGEEEPLDSVAGHIPGAENIFYEQNWGKEGRYLPARELHARWQEMLGETPADEAVFYCGSGVSACVNLLALAHAGFGDGRLYAGSWSEWIRDPERPVATG
jgi:thiosulfate/3-mercaptopyruvate sulfurtransferase